MTAPLHPAGEYHRNPNPSADQRSEWIAEIAALPTELRSLVSNLTTAQLETKYRNWTIRQIVNHLPDSHMNAYVRFKLALTEAEPAIRPYDETLWSELLFNRQTDIGLSLQLLESLHAVWVSLIHSMTEVEFTRSYRHPEYQTYFTLGEALGLYAYHGRHHKAQIEWLVAQGGW
ncbi:MAG: YfiT family bacillithiol transferase [Fimbriiglobus sp.]